MNDKGIIFLKLFEYVSDISVFCNITVMPVTPCIMGIVNYLDLSKYLSNIMNIVITSFFPK